MRRRARRTPPLHAPGPALPLCTPRGTLQQFGQSLAHAAPSASGTTTPASSITYGISPESLPTTATPHAIPSISIRPSCSRHCGVVWLGAARMSIAFKYGGTESCGTPVTTRTRPSAYLPATRGVRLPAFHRRQTTLARVPAASRAPRSVPALPFPGRTDREPDNWRSGLRPTLTTAVPTHPPVLASGEIPPYPLRAASRGAAWRSSLAVRVRTVIWCRASGQPVHPYHIRHSNARTTRTGAGIAYSGSWQSKTRTEHAAESSGQVDTRRATVCAPPT